MSFTDYLRIERYYNDIKEHTFDTVVLSLSLAEAEQLAKYVPTCYSAVLN